MRLIVKIKLSTRAHATTNIKLMAGWKQSAAYRQLEIKQHAMELNSKQGFESSQRDV
jgi:hypothetical protein